MDVQADDWWQRVELALEYLEAALAGHVRIEEAARIACSSAYHFQRIFQSATGYSVGQYVRNRRLWLAVGAMRNQGLSVGEAALAWGYDSPEAFARAFRRRYGVLPSAARRPGVLLEPFERIHIRRPIPGEKFMKYEIRQTLPFSVVGTTIRTSMEENVSERSIPNFWIQLIRSGELDRMLAGAGPGSVFVPGTTFGACWGYDSGDGKFSYTVGVEGPAQLGEVQVPASQWAVFEAVGEPSASIPEVFRVAYAEFFPNEPYVIAPGLPELEVYPPGEVGPDYICQVWFPVTSKG